MRISKVEMALGHLYVFDIIYIKSWSPWGKAVQPLWCWLLLIWVACYSTLWCEIVWISHLTHYLSSHLLTNVYFALLIIHDARKIYGWILWLQFMSVSCRLTVGLYSIILCRRHSKFPTDFRNAFAASWQEHDSCRLTTLIISKALKWFVTGLA